jgi:hypothetical protein
MQGRTANIAVAGASEQRDRGLDPARQPHGDAITGADVVAREMRRQPVRGSHQFRIVQPAMAVAHRECLRNSLRVPRGYMVDRLVTRRSSLKVHN